MPFPKHLRKLLSRHGELVDLRLSGTITPEQQSELDAINAKFDAHDARPSASNRAFEAWMKNLERRRVEAMLKLDEIEDRVRKEAPHA